MRGVPALMIAKIWQERVVSRAAAAHSWQLTIMRPGFVWGPNQPAVIGGMGSDFWSALFDVWPALLASSLDASY